jgi:hypothetical protein
MSGEQEITFDENSEGPKIVDDSVIVECAIKIQRPLTPQGRFVVSCSVHGFLRDCESESYAWKELGFHEGWVSGRSKPELLDYWKQS